MTPFRRCCQIVKPRALVSIRQCVRRAFLRGAILRRWIERKNRLLEKAYLENLVRAGNAPEAPARTKAPSVGSAGALRRVLLIADCLWEKEQLVPEIEKIAPVTVLDLSPGLAGLEETAERKRIVAGTIEKFIEANPSLIPDVVLFYARSSLLSDEAFAALRRRWRGLLLGMNLDDKVEFFRHGIFSAGNDRYGDWARHFDLNLTSSRTAAVWYRQAGLPCRYIAMGYHQSLDLAHPPAQATFDHRLSFVGGCKPEREPVIARLRAVGLPLILFGSGWPGAQRAASPAAVYRRSQMNLGIGWVTSSGNIANLKARDFECPGAGACYLTTYNWELAEHFDIGREILCYSSVDELIEMYFQYAPRPEECLRIAHAAHQRCAREHTWEARFRSVFRELGFKT